MSTKAIKVQSLLTRLIGGAVMGIGLFLIMIAMMTGKVIGLWCFLGEALVIGGLFLFVLAEGNCFADYKGVTVKMPLKGTNVIPYSEITGVYLDVKPGARKGKSLNAPYHLIHSITIMTTSGVLSFKKSGGETSSQEMLANPLYKEAVMVNSPFAELEKTIKKYSGAVKAEKAPDIAAQIFG